MPFMSLTTYQSAISLTEKREDDHFFLVPHCPPDDIESIFYVFCCVLRGAAGPPSLERLFLRTPDTYRAAYEAKHDLYLCDAGDLAAELPERWSPPIRKLFRRFFEFTRDLVVMKRDEMACEIDEGKAYDAYDRMLKNVPEYFRTVESFFEDALTELAENTDEDSSLSMTTNSPLDVLQPPPLTPYSKMPSANQT